jgi:NADPH:quinone reductase-like Zn-dependent oxidoreductase
VIGTASAKNHGFLRKLGADQTVDHETERFEDVVAPVDVVLDTQGGDTQERSWNVLKPGGFLVSTVSPPSTEIAAARNAREKFIFTQANAGQLAEIARVVDAGKLKAYVETILPLSAAKRAQELSQRGHTSSCANAKPLASAGQFPVLTVSRATPPPPPPVAAPLLK